MAGTRTRKTEEERNEEMNRGIYRRQENVRIETTKILDAERKIRQEKKNKENYEAMKDKNDDNKAYEQGILPEENAFSQFNGEPRPRRKRGQLEREAQEKKNDKDRSERGYKGLFPSSVKTNIASTISLAEMREVLKGPRAPALLLSDEEDEARRSGVYDPPPPPRARTARLSTLWETLRESERDSGDRL